VLDDSLENELNSVRVIATPLAEIWLDTFYRLPADS